MGPGNVAKSLRKFAGLDNFLRSFIVLVEYQLELRSFSSIAATFRRSESGDNAGPTGF